MQWEPDAGLFRAWWSTTLAKTYAAPEAELTMGIKHAESQDGLAWDIQEELVLRGRRNPDDWDYSKLETPCVVHVPSNPPERRWLLYYAGANDAAKRGPGYAWYQIGLATSADGRTFTRLPRAESPYAARPAPFTDVEGLVLKGGDVFPNIRGLADGLVADPEVIVVDGVFHMFFSSLAVDAAGKPLAYGVSHATSTDGVHWTPSATNPIEVASGGAGPSIIRTETGTFELFFYRDTDAEKGAMRMTFNPMVGVWKTTSTDLVRWTAVPSTRELCWDGAQPAEDLGWIATGDMLEYEGRRRWYVPTVSSQGAPEGWVFPTKTGFVSGVIKLSLIEQE